MRTTKVKFVEKYLSEGMSDPCKISSPERGMYRVGRVVGALGCGAGFAVSMLN